jgi:hypothetical protein
MNVRVNQLPKGAAVDDNVDRDRRRCGLRTLGVLAILTVTVYSSAAAAAQRVYGVSTKSTVVVAAPRPVVVVPPPRAVVVAPARAVVVAPAPAVVGLPAGYIAVIPTGYTIVVVGGARYYYVGGIHYRAEFYQGRTVYVRVRL